MELSPNDWTLMSLNYFKGEVKRIIEVGTYDHKRNSLVLYHWMEKFPFHQRKNSDSYLNFQFEKNRTLGYSTVLHVLLFLSLFLILSLIISFQKFLLPPGDLLFWFIEAVLLLLSWHSETFKHSCSVPRGKSRWNFSGPPYLFQDNNGNNI